MLNWQFPDGASRLVPSPVFLLSPVRSGSTLLRVILDSHTQIRAPHEMHLNRLRVSAAEPFLQKSLGELGLTTDELENLLWDRVMHLELVLARKSVLVDKTPQNLNVWRRIAAAWPQARFLFLLRHPATIASSLSEARPGSSELDNRRLVLSYGTRLEEARAELEGLTLRYEDLTADPGGVTRDVCSWLGVRWEPGMVSYGRVDHGRLVSGIGDWSAKIRSGKVQPARPLPAEVPAELLDLAHVWGY